MTYAARLRRLSSKFASYYNLHHCLAGGELSVHTRPNRGAQRIYTDTCFSGEFGAEQARVIVQPFARAHRQLYSGLDNIAMPFSTLTKPADNGTVHPVHVFAKEGLVIHVPYSDFMGTSSALKDRVSETR